MNSAVFNDHVKDFDSRFSCGICLMPSLEMVYGRCQHRICVSCLYAEDNTLRTAFQLCPFCFMPDTFAPNRPSVPEDTHMIQKLLGVAKCPHEGCSVNLWEWDVEGHVRNFHEVDTDSTNCGQSPAENCEDKKSDASVDGQESGSKADRRSADVPLQRPQQRLRTSAGAIVRRCQPSRRAKSSRWST